MNILFVNTSKIWGGNEKWTHMASHQLSLKNNVFLAYRSRHLGDRFAQDKQKMLFLNRFDLVTLFLLVRLIRRNKIDILVSTNRKYYLLGGMAARLGGCRHFVRCGIVWRIPRNIYYRLLFNKLIHGIIVNARSIKDELLKTGFIDEHKIHLVYNGLDTKKLDDAMKVKTVKPFDFTLVTSGELVPRKGHEFIIKSFADFLNDNPGVRAGLVLIGKGRNRKKLESFAQKLNIYSRTIFKGFMDNPYPYVAGADLFIITSHNEGISNSLLEAMYLGIPVITTPAGGAQEVVRNRENGFLVNYGDEKALAGLMLEVYNNIDNFSDMIGSRARKTFPARFSLIEMTSSLEKIFEACLTKG